MVRSLVLTKFIVLSGLNNIGPALGVNGGSLFDLRAKTLYYEPLRRASIRVLTYFPSLISGS